MVGREYLLVFAQIFIELGVSPNLAAVVNGAEISVDLVDCREFQVAIHAGGVGDGASERSVRCREPGNGRWRQKSNNVG